MLQQSIDKTGSPVAGNSPSRVQYQQQPSHAPSIQQQSTYNEPQQLIYGPKLKLSQVPYISRSQQSAVKPLSTPIPMLIYNQSPQIFVPVSRAQQISQDVAYKVAAPASQQVVYTVPQQIAYTLAQTPHQTQSTQSAYSISQPGYIAAPQYPLNSAGSQHA